MPKIDVCPACGEYHTDYDLCGATGQVRKKEELTDKEFRDRNDARKRKNFRRPPVDKMIHWSQRKND